MSPGRRTTSGSTPSPRGRPVSSQKGPPGPPCTPRTRLPHRSHPGYGDEVSLGVEGSRGVGGVGAGVTWTVTPEVTRRSPGSRTCTLPLSLYVEVPQSGSTDPSNRRGRVSVPKDPWGWGRDRDRPRVLSRGRGRRIKCKWNWLWTVGPPWGLGSEGTPTRPDRPGPENPGGLHLSPVSHPDPIPIGGVCQ